METAEIKSRWLRFFESQGHTIVPSANLIADDPTLLFVNAGMVPFKPYLLGLEKAPYQRATSVQKCIRTNDIEEVGKTSRHASFFQMNGNFSFGDYFKEGAIRFAWDLMTRSQSEGGYGLDESKLWVSVFETDDEAFELWRRVVDLPAERIVRRGMKDNYWSMGVPGPCGPCSEIFVDRGERYGAEGGPDADEDRFMEIWNLVFMQYERGPGGEKQGYEILGELPAKNIDTGMGLERIASVLQGVDNLYEIDEVFPVLQRAAEMAGKTYHSDRDDDVRLRVIADHLRTSLMLIGDGVTPSNEGRGYVLRRMLRRAVRSIRLLGFEDPALPELLPVARDSMSPSYPELAKDFDRISRYAYAEEQAFLQTLRAGTTLFETTATALKGRGASSLSGADAFKLHDTYGFPIDLTLEMAAEAGLTVDEPGFRQLMAEQKERAKADARLKKQGYADVTHYRDLAGAAGATVFTGYDEVASEGTVKGLLAGGEPVAAASEGDEVEIVLDRTPFYAEMGGQLADQGEIVLSNGAIVTITDVQSPITGLVVHRGRVREGALEAGLGALSQVDVRRRRSISRAHTATHLVHKAFREALGESATQAGSENAPGRFRFDFASPSAVAPAVLRDVEAKVNAVLADDLPVHAELMTQDQAIQAGAMALFGEKYGDEVRVVSVGDWARELCGGTHAQRSGQLGVVTLLGEASIGSGVRRVEALVGVDAYDFLAREHVLVGVLTETLKARPAELPDRVAALVTRLRDAERELDRLRAGALLAGAAGLASAAKDVYGVAFVGHHAPDGTSGDDLRKLVLDVRARIADRPAVVATAAAANGRPVVVVAVNEAARGRGIKAGELVRAAAQVLGGGGGGKDDVAQGGGSDAAKIDDALVTVEHAVGERATR